MQPAHFETGCQLTSGGRTALLFEAESITREVHRPRTLPPPNCWQQGYVGFGGWEGRTLSDFSNVPEQAVRRFLME